MTALPTFFAGKERLAVEKRGIGHGVAKVLLVFLSLTAFVCWTSLAAAQEEDASLATVLQKGVLKICADQWSLPFSGDKPYFPGISLELADLIAKRLKVRLEYNWLDTGGRGGVFPVMKRTLLLGKCDCFVGLPVKVAAYFEGLDTTEPFLGTAFAMVIPEGAEPIKAFEEVRDKKVGAPGNSPPWILLYNMGLDISYG
ncbi:MAG: hypothetical protein GTO55_01105, partial [Armatimonadetes bacterium]|nr:hypothetical protein [Armatimonadota bacterium]NIM22878.1 hypothetical protein [Armatimonadota bacterium]NIM66748.1 hypothetical protein [Armatimonadota bacterium]NIN04941.1 hypothetical protein [Armatimonadota bacterium]NIO95954.1 hypothetical protein [Armatimonadota bacterium]